MRIPDGAEFVNPAENNHFSSVFVFHRDSQTIHDDDTLTYFNSEHVGCSHRIMGIHPNRLTFHSSICRGGLYKFKESARFFKEWILKILIDWDFKNICTAHYGLILGNGKKMLRQTLRRYESKFRCMEIARSTKIGVGGLRGSSGFIPSVDSKMRGEFMIYFFVFLFIYSFIYLFIYLPILFFSISFSIF